LGFVIVGCAPRTDELDVQFREGNTAFLADDFEQALTRYESIIEHRETAELHHNMGVAHYLNGSVGPAVLHLEKALALDSTAAATKEVLSLVRKTEAIPAPSYSLLERMAKALPDSVWMLLLMIGFWGFLGLGVLLYGLIRRRSVYRDLAIGCLFLFVLAFLACVGIVEEGNRGVLLSEENALRIIPTENGEVFMNLSAGQPVRLLKRQGAFVFVETHKTVRGWVAEGDVGSIR